MTDPDLEKRFPEAEDPPPATPPQAPAGPPRRRSFLRGLMQQVQQAGREVMSVAAGKWLEGPEPDSANDTRADADSEQQRLSDRVKVMHAMAEKLRGAADSYIAAKLDEIEARVDAKLDHIERRIDRKIASLHDQLTEMRDRELRHRLRLLKITLIFTVLVALLSLGYKWLSERI